MSSSCFIGVRPHFPSQLSKCKTFTVQQLTTRTLANQLREANFSWPTSSGLTMCVAVLIRLQFTTACTDEIQKKALSFYYKNIRSLTLEKEFSNCIYLINCLIFVWAFIMSWHSFFKKINQLTSKSQKRIKNSYFLIKHHRKSLDHLL